MKENCPSGELVGASWRSRRQEEAGSAGPLGGTSHCFLQMPDSTHVSIKSNKAQITERETPKSAFDVGRSKITALTSTATVLTEECLYVKTKPKNPGLATEGWRLPHMARLFQTSSCRTRSWFTTDLLTLTPFNREETS